MNHWRVGTDEYDRVCFNLLWFAHHHQTCMPVIVEQRRRHAATAMRRVTSKQSQKWWQTFGEDKRSAVAAKARAGERPKHADASGNPAENWHQRRHLPPYKYARSPVCIDRWYATISRWLPRLIAHVALARSVDDSAGHGAWCHFCIPRISESVGGATHWGWHAGSWIRYTQTR